MRFTKWKSNNNCALVYYRTDHGTNSLDFYWGSPLLSALTHWTHLHEKSLDENPKLDDRKLDHLTSC